MEKTNNNSNGRMKRWSTQLQLMFSFFINVLTNEINITWLTKCFAFHVAKTNGFGMKNGRLIVFAHNLKVF